MTKEYFKFWNWLLAASVCLFIQGSDLFFGFNGNPGILVAIMFVAAVLMDGFNQIIKRLDFNNEF